RIIGYSHSLSYFSSEERSSEQLPDPNLDARQPASIPQLPPMTTPGKGVGARRPLGRQVFRYFLYFI
ncbi:hypothetical protein R1flu_006205, partial [Riccia fluitans]